MHENEDRNTKGYGGVFALFAVVVTAAALVGIWLA